MQPTHFAVALFSLGPMLAAQDVIFEENFEQDLGAFAPSSFGTWHHGDQRDPCAGPVSPFPSPGGVAIYGVPGSPIFNEDCWFFSDGLLGFLDLTDPVHLPESAGTVTLTFWSYDETECDSCDWDWRFVHVSDDGGASWTFIGESDRRFNWYQKSLDLTPWRGSDILVRFEMNAVDNLANGGVGWILDDIRIVTDACDAQNMCVAAPNSMSAGGAQLGWYGSKRIHFDDFHLTLDDAPDQQFAHFFYGPDEALTAVADGFLCVGAGATGLTRLLPSGQIDAQGHLERQFDFAASLSGDNWVLPGSTWFFQCWYRDPLAGGTGSNFSDALKVTFCP